MKEKRTCLESLGVYGWNLLEPAIFASLALETPLLLIGKHGTAKSYLLERLARNMKLESRFYNASFLNYDDLLGIPVPIENNTKLSYISNESSIWGAEVVFFDEINRTRPDMQNKLFPIIHEKRVQGIQLEKLKYRWAAMNNSSGDDYLVVMNMDQALLDRFTFIIDVPTWDDLNEDDRRNILRSHKEEDAINIREIVKAIQKVIKDGERMRAICEQYVVILTNKITENFGYISARRSKMFLDSLVAMWASDLVLSRLYNEEHMELEDLCYFHIMSTLPLDLLNREDNKERISALVNECISLIKNKGALSSMLKKDSPRDRLIFVIKHAEEMDDIPLNDAITQNLAALNMYERRIMAFFIFIKIETLGRKFNGMTIEILNNEMKAIENYKLGRHLWMPKKTALVYSEMSKVLKGHHDGDISDIMHSFYIARTKSFPEDFKPKYVLDYYEGVKKDLLTL